MGLLVWMRTGTGTPWALRGSTVLPLLVVVVLLLLLLLLLLGVVL